MSLKGGDMMWRNFRKDKQSIACICISIRINGVNLNSMHGRHRKIRRKGRRWNNAIIIEFNDGPSFTHQSTTRLHFLSPSGKMWLSCKIE